MGDGYRHSFMLLFRSLFRGKNRGSFHCCSLCGSSFSLAVLLRDLLDDACEVCDRGLHAAEQSSEQDFSGRDLGHFLELLEVEDFILYNTALDLQVLSSLGKLEDDPCGCCRVFLGNCDGTGTIEQIGETFKRCSLKRERTRDWAPSIFSEIS